MTIDQLVVVIFLGLLFGAIVMALIPAIIISRRIAREEEDKLWQQFSKGCQRDIGKEVDE